MKYFFSLKNEGHDIEMTISAPNFTEACEQVAEQYPDLDDFDIANNMEEEADELDQER